MYCAITRLGSRACASEAEHASASAAIRLLRSQRRTVRASREIFEFLNHNLIFILQRTFFAGDRVKQELNFFLAGGWHSGSENVFRNHGRARLHRGAPDSFEARAAGFPTHRMRERALGHCKWSEVSRNIEWLNTELRIIFARGLAPLAEFDVHFAVMLIAAPVVEGIHAQDRGRLQVSGVTNHNDVGSVTETAIQLHLRARPLVSLFRDAEMQRTARVGPGVLSSIQIVHSAAIARNRANLPIVAAEMKRLHR